jgi:hypothetical protein
MERERVREPCRYVQRICPEQREVVGPDPPPEVMARNTVTAEEIAAASQTGLWGPVRPASGVAPATCHAAGQVAT